MRVDDGAANLVADLQRASVLDDNRVEIEARHVEAQAPLAGTKVRGPRCADDGLLRVGRGEAVLACRFEFDTVAAERVPSERNPLLEFPVFKCPLHESDAHERAVPA